MIDIGDEVELEAKFTRNGMAVSPTTVTFRVRAPDGTETAVTGVETPAASGIYLGIYTPTMSGLYFYRATGTGSYKAAEESSFNVVARQVTG